MFYVMCQVSGGVTGFRQSPMKKDGKIQYFDRREDAEKVAEHQNKKNDNPYRTCDFRYWVEEI